VSDLKGAHQVKLFEPLEMRDVKARNRIMISPMCQYCAPDAVPRNWHFVHLGSRAVGGAGIVMTEATAVEPEGRITPYDVGLWNDEQEAAFARIAEFVSEAGALPGIQLAHAGRKASHSRPWEDRKPLLPSEGGWEVIGPSALPWSEGDLIPREMTDDDIDRVLSKFQSAATRAFRAGFRVIELHAAHGYLLHSFLSPLSNRRSDGYGGDFNGRIRFLLETIQSVREGWPLELPLFVRISSTDWAEGGWQLTDTVKLAKRLQPSGADVIDCSSGGNVPEQKIDVYPGYHVPFAETVKRKAGIKTAVAGLISEPAHANEIITKDQADIVVIGRTALWDPYWPYHAAKRLDVDISLPLQYLRSNIL
jgi:2,4-dienoyl-CoA reductase-like NADH-dependent reductase (Old Yellow Enzyme family)